MKQFLEDSGIWVIGGMLAVGLLAKFVLWFYYGMLGHACKRPERSKNKTLRRIREDAETLRESPERMRSMERFTEYRLTSRKLAGIYLGIWEEISHLAVPMTLLSGCCLCLGGVLLGGELNAMLAVLLSAGCCGVVLVFLELVSGVEEKKKRTQLFLYTYAEQCVGTEGVPKTEKEKADKPKAEKVRSVGRALEEKRRLTEELLRERRQMEARQLAEQRSRERDAALLAAEDKEEEASLAEAVPEEVRAADDMSEEMKGAEVVVMKEEGDITEQPAVQEEAAAALDPFEQQLQLMLAEFLA